MIGRFEIDDIQHLPYCHRLFYYFCKNQPCEKPGSREICHLELSSFFIEKKHIPISGLLWQGVEGEERVGSRFPF